MGLDISHDAWHGAYSAFHRWRKRLAEVAGIPDLELMEGFGYGDNTGKIKWESLKERPLHILLNHSDCDGQIEVPDLSPLIEDLTSLLPLLDGDGGGHIGGYRDKTQQFIDGAKLALEKGQPLLFR